MRVINVLDQKFEDYDGDLPYAILSHTWREDEVSYSDQLNGTGQTKQGYLKIKYLIEQAMRDGLERVWADTCCIDKTSSAELSEAINSMYRWYRGSFVCYVYLDDIDTIEDIPRSRWIGRGWTLQELIAPKAVKFYGRGWSYLGDKATLAPKLSRWTGIEQLVLQNSIYQKFISVANRFLWTAHRETSRVEDRAYCLLGIFGVNMPLLYGEGKKAFLRLQQEIIKDLDDQSILACHQIHPYRDHAYFIDWPDIHQLTMRRIVNVRYYESSCEISKAGLKTRLMLLPQKDKDGELYWGVLNCRYEGDLNGLIAMELRRDGEYFELLGAPVHRRHKLIADEELASAELREVVLTRKTSVVEGNYLRYNCLRNVCVVDLRYRKRFNVHCKVSDDHCGVWDAETLTSEIFWYDTWSLRTYFVVHLQSSEAIMIRFVSRPPRSPSKETLQDLQHYTGEDALIAFAIKPPGIGFDNWLNQQMPDNLGNLDQIRHSNGMFHKIHCSDWPYLEDVRFQHKLELPSSDCIEHVDVTLSKLQPTCSDQVAWKIKLDFAWKSRRLSG